MQNDPGPFALLRLCTYEIASKNALTRRANRFILRGNLKIVGILLGMKSLEMSVQGITKGIAAVHHLSNVSIDLGRFKGNPRLVYSFTSIYTP